MALTRTLVFLFLLVPLLSAGAPAEAPQLEMQCARPAKEESAPAANIKALLPSLNTRKAHATTSISSAFLKDFDYFYKISSSGPLNEKDLMNVFDAKKIKRKYIESPAHIHYYYETPIGLSKLSRWDFCKEIASSSVPVDFVNLNIDGNYGILNLITIPENKDECRWAATLFTNSMSIQYLMVVKTKCSNGHPEIDANSVIQAFKDALPH